MVFFRFVETFYAAVPSFVCVKLGHYISSCSAAEILLYNSKSVELISLKSKSRNCQIFLPVHSSAL